jgi:L-ascorbate metabolism protein UlaG (beta-lactamase superfamily)
VKNIKDKGADEMLGKISWLGHSSIRISGGKVIYIDPWKIKGEQRADIILISHSHSDHLSPSDVKKIQKEDTTIVAPSDCVARLPENVRAVKPGDKVDLQGMMIEVVPAYNLNKAFHPKSSNWIGFVVTIGDKVIYYAGDTDFIPEMESIKADIAIVPVGGVFTMNAEEAAQAINTIKPQVAIPIHYGDIVGSIEDALKFKNLCKVQVEIKSIAS